MKRSAKIGYGVGLVVALLITGFLILQPGTQLNAVGPANTGHDDVACADCHTKADGTARQQIQANLRFGLGLRETPVNFMHNDVTNDNCLACHDRPNDAHPVFRFNEPRFAEARQAIQPQLCESCHLEHQGRRVTIEPTYCVECHQETEVKNDPASPTHEELISTDQWDTCITCHDFHGNHIMETETDLDQAIEMDAVLAYFEGTSSSPYSDQRQYQAKESLDE